MRKIVLAVSYVLLVVPCLLLALVLLAGPAIVRTVGAADDTSTVVTLIRRLQTGGLSVGALILIIVSVSLAAVALPAIFELGPFKKNRDPEKRNADRINDLETLVCNAVRELAATTDRLAEVIKPLEGKLADLTKTQQQQAADAAQQTRVFEEHKRSLDGLVFFAAEETERRSRIYRMVDQHESALMGMVSHEQRLAHLAESLVECQGAVEEVRKRLPGLLA